MSMKALSTSVVAVEVELEAERSPCRHAQVAQAELLVDEVEVVVNALPVVGLEEVPSGLLVVPWLERQTGFESGEDVDESRPSPALGEDLLDPVLLPEGLLADELDLEPAVLGHALGVVPYLVPQGLRPAGEVEQTNSLDPQVDAHGVGMADVGKGAGDDDPVEAGQHATDAIRVALGEKDHAHAGLREPALCLTCSTPQLRSSSRPSSIALGRIHHPSSMVPALPG
jgi:hypothetical protein